MKNQIRYFFNYLHSIRANLLSLGLTDTSSGFPYIETQRLILRRLNYADAGALFEYFSQDIITKYYDIPTFELIDEADALIKLWNQSYETKTTIRWAIVLKASNQVIGTCGYHNFCGAHYRAEIGYELNPKFWQQGYMTEAIRAIQRYGFKQLKLHRIEAYIFPENLASRKLLNKVGMYSEGVLRDYFWEKNQFIDGEIFSILVNDWEKNSNHIRYKLKKIKS